MKAKRKPMAKAKGASADMAVRPAAVSGSKSSKQQEAKTMVARTNMANKAK